MRLLTQSLAKAPESRTSPFWATAPDKPSVAVASAADIATAVREQLRAIPNTFRAVGKVALSGLAGDPALPAPYVARSEDPTSELPSPLRNSYAALCFT